MNSPESSRKVRGVKRVIMSRKAVGGSRGEVEEDRRE